MFSAKGRGQSRTPSVHFAEGERRNPLTGSGSAGDVYEEINRTMGYPYSERVGAPPDVLTDAMPQLIHAMDGIRKATEGDKKGQKGTKSSLGKEEELDFYLATGCGTLTCEVVEGTQGKEAFEGLKRGCANNKARMRQIKWPCLVSNRIAHGLAALALGQGPYDMSVNDCVIAKAEQLENYTQPAEDKLEPKQRAVATSARG